MPRFLRKYRCTPADLTLPDVQGFHCGDERWEREVADWLKSPSGPNSAREDLHKYGTEVWLHRTEEGELVGVSSLGESQWSWPPPRGPKRRISIIPCVGLHKALQGQPRDAPQKNASRRQSSTI
jgi:hypothetical protein